MGNSCCTLRAGAYNVVRGQHFAAFHNIMVRGHHFSTGSAVAQETSFDGHADASRSTSASMIVEEELHEDEAQATEREAVYRQVGGADEGIVQPSWGERPLTPLPPCSQVQDQVVKLQRTDSVDNMITCCICLDTMYEPVRAPCQHVFCKVCIRRLLEYEGTTPRCCEQLLQTGLTLPPFPAGSSSCPKCRCSLAKMNAEQLQVDLKLLHMIQFSFGDELADRQGEAEEEERLCTLSRGMVLSTAVVVRFSPLRPAPSF